MALGTLVLHRTLQNTAGASGLLLWSTVLFAVWIAGWLTITRLAPPTAQAKPGWHSTWVSAHPLLFTLTVGAGFAGASLIGALVLRELPFLGGDVTGSASRVTDSPLAVFLIALATGLAEELFFRLGLSRLLPRKWFPLVSTVAYGLVTLASGNIALTLAAVLLGATASIALTLTGRWYTPVIVHALWSIALIGVFPAL